MLRPSAIICWIAGTPSSVAGIFTIRFGRLTRSCSSRAAADGALGVVGQAGCDLDADEAVEPVGRVVHGLEDVERAVDVLQHHRPVVVDDRVLGAAASSVNCSS